MEMTTENPAPRKYRCTYCGRNVARVEIVESHRYYCLGTSDHLGTTVDDCRSHVCYHCAQRCMDWDNNDLDNDDAEPTLGRDELAPPYTLRDMRHIRPCERCRRNFGQIRVRQTTVFEFHHHRFDTQQGGCQDLCIECTTPGGWHQRPGEDIPVPENWAEILAAWDTDDALEHNNLPF